MNINFTKLIVNSLTLSAALVVGVQKVNAQIHNQYYSYQLYQKLNDVVYSPETRVFTSSKPFIFEGPLKDKLDSIQNIGQVASNNWVARKVFNEHLIDVKKDDYTFYGDFLPDFVIGKDLMGDKRKTWTNTRGFQVGGTIGDKFSFYSSAYENQAVFPTYMDDYINDKGVIPGQGNTKMQANNTKDWMYATGGVTYAFSKYFRATLAYDKNFIGDGYRSMLLSDFSSQYTHLKLQGSVGNVQYTSMWGYMNDPTNPRVDVNGNTARYGDGHKWGAFQYVDYNATNRLSVGFFQSIIWSNADAAGKRGFDYNYLNPFIFLRPIESNNSSSPDKMFLGLNAKYKVLKNATIYSQFLLGEFSGKDFFKGTGYAHNKWGAQIGFRGFDAFGVKKLNYLFEYNLARPYTYAHFTPESNYSNNAEPLAHPSGANFREILGIVNYSWNRFDFSVQGNYNENGLDLADGSNMGGNIFNSYRTIPNFYGNTIGQGISNQIYYADARVAYVLNPKYNLRVELGYTQRYQKIGSAIPETKKSGVINFGLRSTFRTFYNDF
ncbi:gliding motility protein RemB [Rhinopithecimicrobium faecis]|uniref:gliding motility protein RemB n=1 Tax=Rhinopithecimicrobium faecis TaxID=2820698 RepID=UPI0033654EB5